jgi:membrane-bound ClpP family serine protease
VFTDLESRLIRFTDAVVRDVKAPAPLYEAVASLLSNKQLIEVLMTIGFYMLVSRFLENLEIDIENPPVV